MELTVGLSLLALLVILTLIILSKSVFVIQQSEAIVIERLGSYSKTLHSGLHFVIPFFDQARTTYWVDNSSLELTSRLDMRETVLEVPSQKVITRDNVSIEIDVLLYIQIIDPVKCIYEISNLPLAVAQLAQTSLRNVIGEMDLDNTLVSRDVINAKLKAVLDDATDKWGTKVNRVELKNIAPPKEIQVAMEKQMQAERERRARVLEAEGEKQARIFKSEGIRQEQINIAEGDKEAQIRKAEGEAAAIISIAQSKKEALVMIKSALGDSELTMKYLVATDYIHKFGEFVTKEGDKVFIPYESSASLGAIGTIKEILQPSK